MSSEHAELCSRLTALTRDLILIPSTDSRPEERRRCFEFISNHLDTLEEIQIEHVESNGYESLVAMPQHTTEPDILLCGHIDVIDHPEPDCFHSTIREGRIYGPGAGDMKGADAIMIELFRSMHAMHPGISLGLALTSDEEQGGSNGVRFLCNEKGLRCGQAIIPDGGSLNDITVEEKGVLHLRVRRHGHEAHGARPWLGTNALELLNERLVAIHGHFSRFHPDSTDPIDQHWFPTCSLTIVRTPNRTANRIPAEAEAVLDIRFPPTHSVDSMLQEVSNILGPECEISTMMTAEPTHLAPDPLFCEITEQVTGNPVKQVKASGASDSRFLRQHGTPVNLSRPLVGNLHAIDEWIDIESMATYYRICDAYVNRRLNANSSDVVPGEAR